MKQWLLLALVFVGCKQKEVPYQPPPKDDAAVQPIDAQEAVDAPAATADIKATKIIVGEHVSCALRSDAPASRPAGWPRRSGPTQRSPSCCAPSTTCRGSAATR